MDPLSTINEKKYREFEETSSPSNTYLRKEVLNDSSNVDNSANIDDKGDGGQIETCVCDATNMYLRTRLHA